MSTEEVIDNEEIKNEEILDESQNETPETGTPVDEPEDSGQPELEAGSEETPSWEPVYSYKVRDEEHQFDEWARPLIKDESTYKQFQDLYTRGHGLDLAKKERDEYKEKFTKLDSSLNQINEFVKAGDAERFIESLGLPPKMFMDYAINKLKYQELSPEEKARVDAEKYQSAQVYNLERQNEHLQNQHHDLMRQQRTNELEAGLSSPEVSGLVKEYDARVGRPGAFRQLVVERGIFHSQVNNRDIGAQEAINEAVQLLGLQNVGTQAQNPQAGMGTSPGQPRVVHRNNPVLPNIQGKGTSPLKKRPNSIEDIIKIRNARLGLQD